MKINAEIIASDIKFAEYLLNAGIKPANKGGAFVGNHDIAPESFRRYGIILPKGGMIIPDLTAEELKGDFKEGRKLLIERRNEAVRAAQATRANVEQDYLAKVSESLARYNISGLAIVRNRRKGCKNCSWGAAFLDIFYGQSNESIDDYILLAFGNEAAFRLRHESSPDQLEGEGNHIEFAPLEEVEAFLEAEAQIYPKRKEFSARLQAVMEWNGEKNEELCSCNKWEQAHQDTIWLVAYGNHWSGSLDFGSMQVGLNSAHCLNYHGKTYHFSEEDVANLEETIGKPAEDANVRRERLWKLFVAANGVLARTREAYSVGGEEITHEEREWLLSRSSEIKVPDGYIRVRNDINDLRPFIEMPGRDDILIVEGKTDSRRGVWSYGEWFRGHPSKCPVSYWRSKGSRRKIKSVALNGQLQESKEVDFTLWTDPRKLAKRALQETGINKSVAAYAEALAEVYARQLGKPLEPWRPGMRY